MQTRQLSDFAPVVLRLALASVFLWFGTTQLKDLELWADFVPQWTLNLSGLSAMTLVQINGWMEIILGLMLATGIFVRPVAVILSVHLFVIASDLGMNPVGIRDYGLAFATLAVALHDDDFFCLRQSKK